MRRHGGSESRWPGLFTEQSAIKNLSGEPDLALGSPLPLRETPLTPAGLGHVRWAGKEGRSTEKRDSFVAPTFARTDSFLTDPRVKIQKSALLSGVKELFRMVYFPVSILTMLDLQGSLSAAESLI